jgi:hypothetical protein
MKRGGHKQNRANGAMSVLADTLMPENAYAIIEVKI